MSTLNKTLVWRNPQIPFLSLTRLKITNAPKAKNQSNKQHVSQNLNINQKREIKPFNMRFKFQLWITWNFMEMVNIKIGNVFLV